MTFRLRTIDMTADGREIVRDRDVAQGTLTVGRSAENDIHLPDLAVDPNHARMDLDPGGRIKVAALGSLGFGVDGVAQTATSIDPARGAELRFGSFNITISRDADGTPLLTISQLASQDPGEAGDEKQRFSLAAALPSKRGVSWVLGLLVLALFLAFPTVSNYYHQADPRQPVHGDKAWSTGALSLAHHSLEGNCTACHAKPFEAVRDTTCISCHKDVHDHAPAGRLAMARGGEPLGARMLASIGHTFGKPGPGACSDCHTEHEGAGRMAATRQQFCADCHGTLKSRLTDTRLGNAGDFGTLHPQFTVGVVTDPFAGKTTRASLDAHPRENSGLAFPHKLHLDALGGVARMAGTLGRDKGYGRAGLQCANCHRPTEDGVRFQPIQMERDCQGCHSLAYDKVGNTFRTLQHGDIDQLVADLSSASFNPSAAAVNRAWPGAFGSSGPYYANFAPRYTSAGSVRQALSRDGVCGECHTPTMRGGKLGVVPVTQVSRYMPGGWFDHKAHTQEKCTSCHAAEKSTTSADVLLPAIGQCRTCHLGESAKQAKVPSGCAMCHGYHPTQSAPRASRHDKT